MNGLKIIRFDHLHANPADYDSFVSNLETLIGHPVSMNMPMPDYGCDVAYEPFPVGIEAFRSTSPDNQTWSGRLAATEKGVFSICFKVEKLDEATAFMEEHGWKKLEHYDNGPIQEALFDTKAAFGFYMELIEYPFHTIGEMMAMAAQG